MIAPSLFFPVGLDWLDDGRLIVLPPGRVAVIHTGTAAIDTIFRDTVSVRWPVLLPGGRDLMYTALFESDSAEPRLVNLERGEARTRNTLPASASASARIRFAISNGALAPDRGPHLHARIRGKLSRRVPAGEARGRWLAQRLRNEWLSRASRLLPLVAYRLTFGGARTGHETASNIGWSTEPRQERRSSSGASITNPPPRRRRGFGFPNGQYPRITRYCTFLTNSNAARYASRVIKGFANRDTERLFRREPVRRFPTDLRRVMLRVLVVLDAAESLDDLRSPPGNRLERLRGDREGQHSIRVNDQWRICFTWANGDAHHVELVDYH